MIVTITGVFGLLMILAAFAANEFGFVKIKSYTYNTLNLLGAVFLGVYAFVLKNMVFVVLEIIWAAIALYFIGKLTFKVRK